MSPGKVDPQLFRAISCLQANVESALIGKPHTIKLALTTLFAQGHLLIEDVPGVGKTTLARALARSLDCPFRRIQFTPDLLPSDIIGVSVYDQTKGSFDFKPGPIFASIILADEVNRATPRTQSSLLEAMNDFQVSVDGTTYPLPRPFMVLATQNPVGYEGTYPLPESQLDRFLMRLTIGYPSRHHEQEMMRNLQLSDPVQLLRPVISAKEVEQIQQGVRQVRLEEGLLDYILRLVTATRQSQHLEVGVSPRGSLALMRAVQALALVDGRDYCVPDDIKHLAVAVLAHRVIPRVRGVGGNPNQVEPAQVIQEIIDQTAVPN